MYTSSEGLSRPSSIAAGRSHVASTVSPPPRAYLGPPPLRPEGVIFVIPFLGSPRAYLGPPPLRRSRPSRRAPPPPRSEGLSRPSSIAARWSRGRSWRRWLLRGPISALLHCGNLPRLEGVNPNSLRGPISALLHCGRMTRAVSPYDWVLRGPISALLHCGGLRLGGMSPTFGLRGPISALLHCGYIVSDMKPQNICAPRAYLGPPPLRLFFVPGRLGWISTLRGPISALLHCGTSRRQGRSDNRHLRGPISALLHCGSLH